MATKKVTNLTRQGLPFMYVTDLSGDLEFRTLLSSEIIYMDETRLSQYLLDLATTLHLKIEDSAADADEGWEAVS